MVRVIDNQRKGGIETVSTVDVDPSRTLSSLDAPKDARVFSKREARAALLAEMELVRKEGERLDKRLHAISSAEKVTSFTRDASLVVGSGVATVVAGPAGGAAFRAGVGALSHGAESAVAASLGDFKGENLATQLKGDLVEGAASLVGGKAAMFGANLAMQAAGKQALSAATSKLLVAEAAGLSGATVQNLHDVGGKLVSGESLTSRDVKQAALNYVAAGITAGVSTKVPSGQTLSAAHVADFITSTGVAAGQQYALEGKVALDSTLLAGLQNATMSAALAKHVSAGSRPVVHMAEGGPVNSSTLKVSGIADDGVRSGLQREVLQWRDKSGEWSPLQRWLVEEAERRGIETEVVVAKDSRPSSTRVQVEVGSTYGSSEEAFVLARREMYLKVGELSTGKKFELSSPEALYLHRLCEELAVATPHLERAKHEMLRAHGSDLVRMGLGNLNRKTDGDLRTMIQELRRNGHAEQADYYKESLRRSGIEVEHEHANRGLKIPVYGLADQATVDSLRRSLAEWRTRAESWSPLQKWVMERAEQHNVEVIVIHRGSHAYDGTRVGVALDDVRSSHGAFEIARHELWHAVSSREFFDKVDPKRLDRKQPASLYIDELLAHLAAGRTKDEAHTHVMHNYGPSFKAMDWPATYERLGGDMQRILDEVGRTAGPRYKDFYRLALTMAGVEVD